LQKRTMRFVRWWLLWNAVCLACLGFVAQPVAAQPAPPVLALPTPPGEAWRVIQGYGCGTHEGWDYYALDLVSDTGTTLGAPVRAAADGSLRAWVEESGTLILDHGNNFFTMYTHMEPAGLTEPGVTVLRGQQVGTVGERGTPGNPHLHFMAYTADGEYGLDNRRSLPLQFAEGYTLPEIGGCSQHLGTLLTAAGVPTAWFAPRKRQMIVDEFEHIYCYTYPAVCML
jgi:murein DD-endopeptidase MepM/ murein hydrolase activator NlpD